MFYGIMCSKTSYSTYFLTEECMETSQFQILLPPPPLPSHLPPTLLNYAVKTLIAISRPIGLYLLLMSLHPLRGTRLCIAERVIHIVIKRSGAYVTLYPKVKSMCLSHFPVAFFLHNFELAEIKA